MAGMRTLGFSDYLLPGNGLDICLKDVSAISFVANTTTTAATSLTVVAKPSFGGSSTLWTPANGFGQPSTWFLRSANGTVTWAPQTASWASNVLTIGGTLGNVSQVDFLVSQLADTFDYINVVATNCTVAAILYHMTVMRKPANLRIPSA